MTIKWTDWRKQKPTEPGYYLVWSPRFGMSLTKEHPSWWNLPARRAGGSSPGTRVRMWCKVADFGVGLELRAALRR